MPELNAVSSLDYMVLVFYMLLIIGLGIFVSTFNRQSRDYFTGGGRIPWGLSMVSLFISGFSAFMFVGAAGVAYKDGFGALVLFSLAAPAYLLGYYVYGRLWHRSRIQTPMEFLSRRFSQSTTYFFTLLALLPNVLTLGILIYTLCIFISTAFGFTALQVTLGMTTLGGLQVTILVTGLVLLIYTLFGGLWGVVLTDALQFIILFIVTLIVLFASYHFLGDGNLVAGAQRMIAESREGYFDLQLTGRPWLFWVAYFVNIILGYNVNWHIAQRYYSVPNERDTRKMALWCAGLSLVLPLMWVLPVMTAPILFPDMATLWPELSEPGEAAFVTLALATLPAGLIGLLVAGIFAATMSSVDTMLNWMAAVITRDAYIPVYTKVMNYEPSDSHQLTVARLSVGLMGFFAIWMALNMDKYGGAFDVYLRADSLYRPAMFMPVMLGLVFLKTPWWSAMLAFGGGVVAVLFVSIAANLSQGLEVSGFGSLFLPVEVTVGSYTMGRYEMNTLAGVTVSGCLFLGSYFFKGKPGWYQHKMDALIRDLATPVEEVHMQMDERGLFTYRIAGICSIGLSVLLLVFAVITSSPLNGAASVLAFCIGMAILAGIKYYNPNR